jgi:hypothetical protein
MEAFAAANDSRRAVGSSPPPQQGREESLPRPVFLWPNRKGDSRSGVRSQESVAERLRRNRFPAHCPLPTAHCPLPTALQRSGQRPSPSSECPMATTTSISPVADVKASRHNLAPTHAIATPVAPTRSVTRAQRNSPEGELCRQKRVWRHNPSATKTVASDAPPKNDKNHEGRQE